MPSIDSSSDSEPTSPGALRQVCESVIILAISVTIFRIFAAEGYLISTGSMAPSLLGYHKQVTCPSCHYTFPRGVPVEESAANLGANVESPGEGEAELVTIDSILARQEGLCSCPNCGLKEIALADFPRNEGDQLLVHKNIYDLRDPHRWEVVVFRNPDDPAQPYVKRVVGLPGETIRLHEGNVYANDHLQRKPLAAQRGVRIPVDDHDFEPGADSPDWQPRWKPVRTDSGWRSRRGEFSFAHDVAAPVSLDWVAYRNWVRESEDGDGGTHRVSVPLKSGAIRLPASAGKVVTVDRNKEVLVAVGSIPAKLRDEILALNPAPETARALHELYERSHIAPITDHYGYNRGHSAPREYPVHDLMVSCDLDLLPGATFVLELSDDQRTFVCEFHADERQVYLSVDKGTEPIRKGVLPPVKEGRPQTVEFSVMDRQVLVAIDGELLFEPLLYATKPLASRSVEFPVRFAATGGSVTLTHLRLDRDVYYTPKNASEDRDFVLGPSEFLVLGDNSPVSVDSRAWDDPAIARNSLIGKPFIVHLPSRQARWDLGGDARYIRLPDFSKVRYIR